MGTPPVAASQNAEMQNVPGRVLVKLRDSFGGEVAAALRPGTLALDSTDLPSIRTQDFFKRYGVSTMTPLFRQYADARLVRGLSEAQVAARIRKQFAARTVRFKGAPPQAGLERIYVLTTSGTQEQLLKLVDQLNADPDVEYAQLDYIYSVGALPNDPYLSSQGTWGQSYLDLWGISNIGASTAWSTSTGAGVKVAVIDTGIDLTHPDIAASLWTNPGETPGSTTDLDGDGFPGDYYGWDFVSGDNDLTDRFGHGTHVAGTIAATANNGIGVAGVAYNARVMTVKGLGDNGSGAESGLAAALVYAANRGADVVNMSWGRLGSPTQVMTDAIQYAYSLGVVLVAAAGNSGVDASGQTPASLPQVIAVAAIEPGGTRANFSNFGPKIDVAAPGVDILSLQATGSTLAGAVVSPGYERLSGTSMAAPHVAALAALILSRHPEFTNEQVRQVLRASASSAGQINFDTGSGVIRCAAALAIDSPLEARIASPANRTVSSGIITVRGSAQGATFASYRLEYGTGASPTSWTTLVSSPTPVSEGVLGTLDASQLTNGTYTIRLVVVSTSGGTFYDRVVIQAQIAAITKPELGTGPTSANMYKLGSTIPIAGTAIGSGFQSYTLEWAPGTIPTTGWRTSGITVAGGGTTPVASDVLGGWDTSAITTAGYYTLRLTVYRTVSNATAMTVVYLEPDLVSTVWPLWLPQGSSSRGGVAPVCSAGGSCQLVSHMGWSVSSPGGLWIISMDGTTQQLQFPLPGIGSSYQPAVANLAGLGEQIVATDNNRLRLYNQTGPIAELVPPLWSFFTNTVAPVADLAGNGTWTVLAFGYEHNEPGYPGYDYGGIHAWTGLGTPASGGFPIIVQDRNLINAQGSAMRVIAADIDGDGRREIIVSEGFTEDTFTLRLYSFDGTPRVWAVPALTGVPLSLAAGDLDGDGNAEVVLVAYDKNYMLSSVYATIHVFQPDGSERAGWPRQFPIDRNSRDSYLAIGDLAQDGRKEIVWSAGTIAVLNADGTSYSSAWPKRHSVPSGGVWGKYGPVVLGDVDGDGKPEIVTNSIEMPPCSGTFFTCYWYWDSKVIAFHLDGTIVRSWQLTGMNGYDPYEGAFLSLGNFSGSGKTEIAVLQGLNAVNGLQPDKFSIYQTGVPYNSALNPWPYVYGNRQNNPVLAGPLPPDFVLAANPNTVDVTAGAAATTAVTVTSLSGTTAVNTAMIVSGLPSGVTASFAPSGTAGTSTLNFTASASAAAGTFNLTIVATGRDGVYVHTVPVTLRVTTPVSAQCSGCYFISNGLRATLAFNVSTSGTANSFTYNYRSTSQAVQFRATAIPQVSGDGRSVTFSGQGTLNGRAGYSFTVTAADGGKAGSGLDAASVVITGPSGFSYSASGSIAGGDVIVRQL